MVFSIVSNDLDILWEQLANFCIQKIEKSNQNPANSPPTQKDQKNFKSKCQPEVTRVRSGCPLGQVRELRRRVLRRRWPRVSARTSALVVAKGIAELRLVR